MRSRQHASARADPRVRKVTGTDIAGCRIAYDVFEPPAEALLVGIAERMARALSLGLGHGRLVIEHPSRSIGPLYMVS